MTASTQRPLAYSYRRFSSSEQAKGDSLRRQEALIEAYAKERELEVDNSLRMQDLGLSAFSGEHKTKGALGKFLECVENGRIPRGSYLLVESLDRLSRERVLEALMQFINIIKAGIIIVTLSDKMIYSQETIDANYNNLIISLTKMSMAHEESLQKSRRLLAAWSSKREKLSSLPMTKIVPAWLKLGKDGKINAISDRVEVVKRIFSMYIDGFGAAYIARTLNMEKVPAWRSKKGWHKSYVQKIIKNRSVIGEFQPHVMSKNKRLPSGEPVKGYFPSIISEDEFINAQIRRELYPSYGGKNGKLGNLFGHVAKCGYCGAPMQYVNKGKPPKGGTYLVCDNARRGYACEYKSIPYKEVEDAFLSFCTELDITNIIASGCDNNKSDVDVLKSRLNHVDARINYLDKSVSRLNKFISESEDEQVFETTKQSLHNAKIEMDKCLSQRQQLSASLQELLSQGENMKAHTDKIQSMVTKMYEAKDEKALFIRQRLRSEIRKLVNKIEVFPAGMKNFALSYFELSNIKIIDTFKSVVEAKIMVDDPDIFPSEEDGQIYVSKLESRLKYEAIENTGRNHRSFLIWFPNGACKHIGWKDNSYAVLSDGGPGHLHVGEINWNSGKCKERQPLAVEI